jgi:DNA repair protein RecN (Recombination protein N)
LIENLSIRSLGVISSAELELAEGFTAITGETGAGKTMLLAGLGLLLGDRADSTVVRSGERQLIVEGRILSSDAALHARLEELGAEVEAGEILINRIVTADGRSKAAIGGISVPVSVLNSVAQELVAVHGQSEQIRLRSPSKQREALDAFGGEQLALALGTYSPIFQHHRELEMRRDRLRNASQQEAFRIERLKVQIADLERIAPAEGELQQVSEQLERLGNVESLRLAADEVYQILAGEELDVRSQLGRAKRSLENASDPKLRDLAQQIADASAVVGEVVLEISSYLTELDADPQTLDALQRRKAELTGLGRKYGATADELARQLPDLRAELSGLDSSDEQLEKLEIQLVATRSQLAKAAEQLSELRQSAAEKLSEGVSEELAKLSMRDSKLLIRVSSGEFESFGADRVEFLLTSHAGSEPRPLSRGASGGELSRIMLAIELVLAGRQPLPTMIFDEVDAGVGGAAAVELGRRLKKLADSTQVIVVTHLPQVAAFADQQIQIFKDQAGGVSASSVKALGSEERVRELARMLSGSSESEIALNHARELLSAAS